MLKPHAKLIFSIIFLLLTACATVSPIAPVQTAMTWPQRQEQLSAIKNWTLRSAFSVREANRAQIGSLVWQQQGNYFTQRITGPFSLGGVIIQGTPGRVTLIQGANRTVTASSPEALLAQELHLHLPISNLYYWVRGIPAPGIPASTQFDQQNHLVTLRQSGWVINYVNYTNVNGIDLPSTIELSNPQIQAKMVIKQWQLG